MKKFLNIAILILVSSHAKSDLTLFEKETTVEEDITHLSNKDINRRYSKYKKLCNREKLSFDEIVERMSWYHQCFPQQNQGNNHLEDQEIIQYPIGLYHMKGAKWHYLLPTDRYASCALPKQVHIQNACYAKTE
tara:strand:- start:7345 stop:7746 length:402 start_codon:yes stop_codon:yes gene_type:complete